MPKTVRSAVLAEGVKLPFPEKRAIKYAEKILSIVRYKKSGVCIFFVDDARIKRLNKKYRKKNKATDVLAFETGDIALSAETAEKNSRRFGSTPADELK